MLRSLPAALVERMRACGWVLTRTYSETLSVAWQSAFGATAREEVEAYCAENAIACAWDEEGTLRTSQVRPGIVRHPQTGDEVWFNHMAFWNRFSLDEELREVLLDELGPEGLPFDTGLGDGVPLTEADLAAVNAAYERATVRRAWQPGDLLIVDNVLTAHGRDPFRGDRRIVVAMGDPVAVADCAPTVAPVPEPWRRCPVAEPTNLVERFLETARTFPGRAAVHAADGALTFEELAGRTARLAAALRALGVRPGDRVGVSLPRGTGWAVAPLAVWRAGAAYVPLDPAYPGERLAHIAADAGLRAVVARAGAAAEWAEGLPVLDPDTAHPDTAAPAAQADAEPSGRAGHPATAAYVIHTSGTSGLPKGVEVTTPASPPSSRAWKSGASTRPATAWSPGTPACPSTRPCSSGSACAAATPWSSWTTRTARTRPGWTRCSTRTA